VWAERGGEDEPKRMRTSKHTHTHTQAAVFCTASLVLLLCRHTVSELGASFVTEMRKPMRTRTYSQAKPKALTNEQW
jgi:hypothetical protein